MLRGLQRLTSRLFSISSHVFDSSPLLLPTVAGYVPKKPTQNDPDCGEDAYFVVTSEVDPHFAYLGVADGVGGFAQYGIDPSVVSNGLMDHSERLVKDAVEVSGHPCVFEGGPKFLLMEAFLEICMDPDVDTGSTTVTLAFFDGHCGKISGTNLGDSGVRILRKEGGRRRGNYSVAFKSEIQTYGFNFPAQLMILDHEIAGRDLPIDAEDFEVDILPGDLLLTGSDGLFDNIYDEEICSLLEQIEGDAELSPDEWLEEARDVLLATVSENARSGDYQSPFATEYDKEVTALGREDAPPYHGGKLDDITFLLSVAVVDDQ